MTAMISKHYLIFHIEENAVSDQCIRKRRLFYSKQKKGRVEKRTYQGRMHFEMLPLYTDRKFDMAHKNTYLMHCKDDSSWKQYLCV